MATEGFNMQAKMKAQLGAFADRRAIEVAQAVKDAGGVRAAAKHLGISAARVSQYLKRAASLSTPT